MAIPQSKKIVEISGNSWMGGITPHPYVATGGLFQEATNFDPFERIGIYIPNKTPTQRGSSTIVTDITAMISSSTTAIAGVFIHAFTEGAAFYRINTTDGSVVDQQARISINSCKGAIVFKNKTIYTNGSSVFSHDFPVSAQTGNEVTILGALESNQPPRMAFHIGPDRQLYMTNGRYVARITNVTGTSNNDAQFLSFEENVFVRDLDDDGQSLIIVGDTNRFNPFTGGIFRCFVAFWNMKSQDLTRIWEFTDNTIFGVAAVENEVLIMCRDNTYTCSVNTRPKVLVPLKGNATLTSPTVFANPYSIVKKDNSTVLWGSDTNMRGYGRLHPSLPKTLFTAYTIPNGNIDAAISVPHDDGVATIWAANSDADLFEFDTTSTETSTIRIAGIDFKQPYEFDYAKVILSEKLASGQAVHLQITTDETNNVVLRDSRDSDNPFTFSQVGGKKSHIFYPFPGVTSTSTVALFEDLSDIRITNVGASVRRVEIWGKPQRPDQDIYK